MKAWQTQQKTISGKILKLWYYLEINLIFRITFLNK